MRTIETNSQTIDKQIKKTSIMSQYREYSYQAFIKCTCMCNEGKKELLVNTTYLHVPVILYIVIK